MGATAAAAGSLSAQGGWVSPGAIFYDLYDQEVVSSESLLPEFKVSRGAITYSLPLTAKDQKFLDMAMGVALTSECRMKHGAVVVKHGHVLGFSANIWRNNPKNVDPEFCSVHAEIAALRKAGMPKKATVYVARVNNHGEPRLSKPCANCQEVLDGLKAKVYYTE